MSECVEQKEREMQNSAFSIRWRCRFQFHICLSKVSFRTKPISNRNGGEIDPIGTNVNSVFDRH